jgi:hypothetical protein
MKTRTKRLLTIFIILFVIGAGFGTYKFVTIWYMPKRNVAKEKPAYTLTTVEVAKDFSSDTTAAEKKYKNNVIEVSGIVSSIEKDKDKNVNLIFDTTGVELQFTFLNEFNEEASKLKKGDKVKLKGNYTGYSNDDIFGLQVKFNNGFIDKETK